MHPYLHLFIHGIQNKFANFKRVTNHWYGLSISMMFFSLFGNMGKKRFDKFTEDFNNHQSNIKFTYTSSKNYFPFDLDVKLSGGKPSWFLLAKCVKNTFG